ncbi:hypothetical protein OG474_24880 [Kribbella sp. NBC_01505]|uniref:hypothetical protein n=1 Tax=Kribbella sp. NBC_01505 TaxID=2903580 RepID=UPI00386DE516
MNMPGKRLVLGAAVAVAALGVGGIAYAAGGDDPAPGEGYVTFDDGVTFNQGTAATPSPSAPSAGAPSAGTPEQSTPPSTTPKQGDGRHRGDCPDKDGSQSRPSQPQQTQPAQPSQPAQPEQSQPSQPEQNPAGNA